jgi:muramoyltetrapeptide carboxypeptidase
VLTRGDRIGVVAPAFAIRPDALDRGLGALRRYGFVPVEGSALRARDAYFAGPDAARADDLQAVIDDPGIRGVWFARGGYGTARLLDRLDLGPLKRRSKTLIGASDVSALFAAHLARARGVCLHGPFVSQLGRAGAFHRPSLAAMLAGRTISRRMRVGDVLVPGRAAGRLMGGNLTVLVHLLGTRHMPDLRGAVLFLEELGEEAYRLDRLLNHLRMSGALRGVRSVLLGHLLVPPTRRPFPPDRDVAQILRDHLAPLGVPVVTGIPAGHGEGTWTLPLGGHATVDTGARRVTFSPRAVAPPGRRGAVR